MFDPHEFARSQEDTAACMQKGFCFARNYAIFFHFRKQFDTDQSFGLADKGPLR